MSLRKKLMDLFYKAATGTKKVKLTLTPLGILFFFGGLFLFFIISLWLDKVLRFKGFVSHPLNLIISIPLIIFGFLLTLWCVLTFFKKKGTPVPFNPPPKLIKEGPYKYVRNPMLTGLFILMFGIGILVNSISFTFIFTPLFIVLMFAELKAVEEPELERRFGEEYISYKKEVPMFIPRLSGKIKERR